MLSWLPVAVSQQVDLQQHPHSTESSDWSLDWNHNILSKVLKRLGKHVITYFKVWRYDTIV